MLQCHGDIHLNSHSNWMLQGFGTELCVILYMCVYAYIYTYIHMYKYVHVYTCIYIYIHTYIYMNTHEPDAAMASSSV